MADSAPSPPPQHQIGLTVDPSKVLNILSDFGHNNVRMELGGEKCDFINEIYIQIEYIVHGMVEEGEVMGVSRLI